MSWPVERPAHRLHDDVIAEFAGGLLSLPPISASLWTEGVARLPCSGPAS